MKFILNKCLFILLPIFVLNACSAGNSSVDNQSDLRICKGLAKYGSFNMYYEARVAAVKSRNINCNDYESEIANQLQLDRIEGKLADIKSQAAADKRDAIHRRNIKRILDDDY